MNQLLDDVTKETMRLAKEALNGNSELSKAITTATGLTGYSLEAPAKRLYPVLSPLRNRINRNASPVGATAVNWKQITGINSSKVWGSVAFGVRNSEISYATASKSQSFKTIGLDDSVQDESIWMGRGFEDVRALSAMSLLQSVMIQEEFILLGGNVTAIGKPASVTAAAATGGSLSNSTTYDFSVSALTLQGFYQGATGHASADAAGETDARTGSLTTGGAGTALALTWPAVRGAVAYNVYAGSSSGTKYYIATVTANAYTLLALVGSGNVANSTDQTANALDFDGIIPQMQASAGNGYFKDLANATLTADNAGGIVEFDTLLQSLWDNYKVGPSVVVMNSQEALNVTKKVSGSTALQFKIDVADGANNISGGVYVANYLNKFASGTQPGLRATIPFMIHPYIPAGTILFLAETLPYMDSQVSNTFELEVLQEYANFEWARTTRRYEHGVYLNEALKAFAPFAQASLVGIKNG